MGETQKDSGSHISTKLCRGLFWFLGFVGVGLVIAFLISIITGIGLLPIVPPSPPTQTSVDLSFKMINIVLIFFTVVSAFLAFFGYREISSHEKLRQRLEEQAHKLDVHAKKVEDGISETVKQIAEEREYMSALNLARIFYHLRYYDKAMYFLNQIVKSLTYEAPLLKAEVSIGLKNCSEALRWVKEALEFDTGDREKGRIYFARGKIYGQLKNYEQAISDYEECINLVPNHLDAYVMKAYSLRRLGPDKLDEAIRLLDQALAINKDDADSYYNRACYYSLKDDKNKMESDLREAIRSDKHFVCNALVDPDFEKYRDVVRNILSLS